MKSPTPYIKQHSHLLELMSEAEKELFALVYDSASRSEKPFLASQGFWRSCLKHKLDVDFLQLLAQPQSLNSSFPFVVKRVHRTMQKTKDASYVALQTVLEHAPRFNLNDPRQLIKILELTAQTLRPTQSPLGLEIQSLNRTIALQHLEQAQNRLREISSQSLTQQQTHQQHQHQVKQHFAYSTPINLKPYHKRLDEYGQKVETGSLVLWHASHKGPVHAAKTENQDATFVRLSDEIMTFALADGVSTSMGARLSAAVSVQEFCNGLSENLQQQNGTSFQEMLWGATEKARNQLEKILISFLSATDSDEFALVRGQIQPAVAQRLLENTMNPTQKNWGAALATTLIGGFIMASENNSFDVHLMYLGDGVAELYNSNEQKIERLLDIDADVTEISHALCPGPLGKEGLQNIAILSPFTMRRGDWLLISSDGLARGHHSYIFSVLENAGFTPTQESEDEFAWNLLERTASSADAENANTLFNDNLSLILLTVK